MLVQAIGLVLALALLDTPLLAGVLSATALGLGTAMVYPALIASVSDHAHPSWRANALGTYRFWRDIGYAAGALIAGVLAGTLGLNATVIAAALLTAASGILAARWITDAPNHWTSADDVETVAAATPASPRVLAGECRCGGNRRHEKPRSASFADPGCSRDGWGQWWPWAVSEAPPKSRATARKGRVTTVAMAPPMDRITSAIAFSM